MAVAGEAVAVKKPKKKRTPKNPEGRMSLGEHLVEARNRLLICAVTVLILTIAGWFLSDRALEAIIEPFKIATKAYNVNATPNLPSVGSALDLRLRVSAYIGLILSSPMILFQLWRYITPGLKHNERKYALGFLFSSTPLFLAGCAAGYWAMSKAVPLFISFTPEKFTNLINFSDYMNLFIKTVLVFGIAFTLPVVLVALNMVGILRGRTMLKAWRWVVFVIFAFTAVMVPTPDPFSMVAMAGAICSLYFAAVGISMFNDRRRDKREALLEDTAASSIGEVEAIDGPSSLDDEADQL